MKRPRIAFLQILAVMIVVCALPCAIQAQGQVRLVSANSYLSLASSASAGSPGGSASTTQRQRVPLPPGIDPQRRLGLPIRQVQRRGPIGKQQLPTRSKQMHQRHSGQKFQQFTIGFGQANPIFSTELSYASGGDDATSVAEGDFNGDGIPDLAVTNYFCTTSECAGSSVSILLGNGDGTFQAAVPYSTGAYEANSVAVAALRGVGQPLDLVVTHYCNADDGCGAGVVSVLLGKGDGTFQTASAYGLSHAGYSAGIGDVNGDGKLDLVVAEADDIDTDPGYIGVLYGNGDGTFQQQNTPLSSGGFGTYSLSLKDVDGDGLLDVVAGNFCQDATCATGSVSVLLGKNGFQQPAIYGSGGYGVYSVVVRDVNGDGKPDIAVANYCKTQTDCSSGLAGVLLGNGDGTFQIAATYPSGGILADSAAIADVNGDGKPDLVVANQCASPCLTLEGGVAVLLGNGDGTFQTAVPYRSGGILADSVVVADVNGDNKPDLVVVNPCVDIYCTQGTVGVLLGNGDGSFESDDTYQTNYQTNGCGDSGCATGTYSVAEGDFNGDGIPDLAVSNRCADSTCATGSVSVFIGNGDGTYQLAVNYFSSGHLTNAVVVGDFNGDHILDLALVDQCRDSSCSSGSGSVSVLLGDGKGAFGTATQFPSGGQYSDSIAVGDFNKDGKLDLAVGNYSICGDGCQNGSVGVLLGNGDGSFQTATVYNSGGIQASSIAVADLNGDTYPDLAVANPCADLSCSSGGLIGILLNKADGTGNFQSEVGYASGGFGAQSLAIADLNGDGKLDLAVANASASPGNLGVLLGNGDGSFKAAQTFLVDGQPVSVAIGDLNGDGIPDLAYASNELCGTNGCDVFDGAMGVLLGNGDGTFQSSVDYAQGALVGYALIATDLNGDFKPDLAVVRDGSLTIFPNIVTGYRFGTTTTLASSLNPAPQFQPVTFTATVTPQAGQGVPTGNVAFYDGSTELGTGQLNGGQPDQASFTTSTLSVGNHTITANYAGDGNFLPSVSAPLIQVINTVAPTITVQPASQSINYGQTATLTVTAIGTPPLSYQWYLGQSGNTSSPIAGATNASYTTPALTVTTSYWVQVSGVPPAANSNTATITVGPQLPTITTQPANQTINYNETATLTVVATGGIPLSYQWYQGTSPNTANPIAGATSSSYTTPALTATTDYWVQVSNAGGKANSTTAIITVNPPPPPTITMEPASQTINSGQTATLTVTATSMLPLSYQWYQGMSPNTSNPIAGATSSSYTTAALTMTTDYWVQVTNAGVSANSTTAVITVIQPSSPPVITTQPVGQTVDSDSTATLTVTAAGTLPLMYQWYQGNSGDLTQPIIGANGNSYTTTPLAKTTEYWVNVTNTSGQAASNTATITVNGPTCTLTLTGGSSGLQINAAVSCIDKAATQTTIDCGDGSTPATGTSATCTYKTADSYTVTATTTDTLGLVVKVSAIATVTSQTGPTTTAGTPVQAPASFSPNAGVTSPPRVVFDCTSLSGPGITGADPGKAGIGCTFSPPSATLDHTVNVQITITSQARGSASQSGSLKHLAPIYATWLPLPGLVLVGLGYSTGKHKKLSRFLALWVATGLLVICIACGGGSSSSSTTVGTPGTPAGQYYVTVQDPIAPGSTSPTGFQQISLIVPVNVQ